MKAVLERSAVADYDPARGYPFKAGYLAEAREAVGDWVIYHEPSRHKGRGGYVAVARLVSIEPYPAKPNYYYGTTADYLDFGDVVPLRRGDGSFYEGFLTAVAKPSLLGVAMQGRSVRTLSEGEFGAIVRAGLATTLAPDSARRLGLEIDQVDSETLDLLRAPVAEQERQVVQVLLNRKLRDAAFRAAVLHAYDNTCAVTRLRIVDGGGRAEAQAAHIWPVADGGLDVVQNGLALSATAHWLFDRHLISLTDDLGLLVSHNKVSVELQALFEQQRQRIRLPKDEALWPHLDYVRRHRAAFTSG